MTSALPAALVAALTLAWVLVVPDARSKPAPRSRAIPLPASTPCIDIPLQGKE